MAFLLGPFWQLHEIQIENNKCEYTNHKSKKNLPLLEQLDLEIKIDRKGLTAFLRAFRKFWVLIFAILRYRTKSRSITLTLKCEKIGKNFVPANLEYEEEHMERAGAKFGAKTNTLKERGLNSGRTAAKKPP